MHSETKLLGRLHFVAGGLLALAGLTLHELELLIDVLLGLGVELLLLLGHFVLGHEVLVRGLCDSSCVVQVVCQAVVFGKGGGIESFWDCGQTKFIGLLVLIVVELPLLSLLAPDELALLIVVTVVVLRVSCLLVAFFTLAHHLSNFLRVFFWVRVSLHHKSRF